MNKLSVVIITYNEAANIGCCIDSVQGLADEVLVVDSFSTDNTVSIATSKGARVLTHAFEGHIQQKNWARLQAIHPYVLSLDGDEALNDELRTSILAAKNNFTAQGYTMNRLNYYCGEPIKTCGWYPDTKLRLWQNSAGEWRGLNPHDRFELFSGTPQHLSGDILHNTYPTKQALLNQVDKFATISAQHLKNLSVLHLLFKLLFSAPAKFFKNYVLRLGFTSGLIGLTICFHQSREVALKYYRALKFKFAA